MGALTLNPGFVEQQVGLRCIKQRGVVEELSNALIAARAENAANLASGMAMIDSHSSVHLSVAGVPFAYRALSFLRGEDGIVLGKTNSIEFLKQGLPATINISVVPFLAVCRRALLALNNTWSAGKIRKWQRRLTGIAGPFSLLDPGVGRTGLGEVTIKSVDPNAQTAPSTFDKGPSLICLAKGFLYNLRKKPGILRTLRAMFPHGIGGELFSAIPTRTQYPSSQARRFFIELPPYRVRLSPDFYRFRVAWAAVIANSVRSIRFFGKVAKGQSLLAFGAYSRIVRCGRTLGTGSVMPLDISRYNFFTAPPASNLWERGTFLGTDFFGLQFHVAIVAYTNLNIKEKTWL